LLSLAAINKGIAISTCIDKGSEFDGESIEVDDASENEGGSAEAAPKIKLMHHVSKFKVPVMRT
jgi:hypothetical protein